MEHEKVDIIAFGAHPDDVEITCAGTLVKMNKKGYSTGIVDMTHGEKGTYGTVEERKKEAADAANILDLSMRKNLGLDDGGLENTHGNRMKTIEIIRSHRPDIVLAPYVHTRHPDHSAVGNIVTDASFLAGLEKIETGIEKFRPSAVLYYTELYDRDIDFVVDISDEWETKVNAIQAHRSQVFQEKSDQGLPPKTLIKSPEFFEFIESKFRYFGGIAGVTYAEVFVCNGPVRVNDLIKSFSREIT